MANLEVRTEVLSESANGRPILIDTDYTTAADVTPIHAITQNDVLDAVYLEVFNTNTGHNITCSLVLSPATTTSTTDIDAATVSVTVPRGGSVWILQGQRFRRTSGASYTIAAYAPAAYVSDLYITGWYSRVYQPEITA